MINEKDLQQLCLDWFRSIGYEVIDGRDIAPDKEKSERRDFSQVILVDRLLNKLQSFNPHIPLFVLEQTVQQIEKAETPILIKNNKNFYQSLLEGVKVHFKDENENKVDYVQLVDFANPDNNEFLVVYEYSVKGIKQIRRPDIVVFINGLPLAVIELKNPADETVDIWAAYRQLQTYKEEISDLFIFNQALVISDGINARVGSLTATEERFAPWRTLYSEGNKPTFDYQLETMVKGFFCKELLLDYIHYFVLFEQDGSVIEKKIAGYHQFHAVRQAVAATIVASQKPLESNMVAETPFAYGSNAIPGSGKAGVIWHTQGSGKSISMICYAGKLLSQPKMNNPTLVIVTDRNDLDGQLFDKFTMASEGLKQIPVQADNREELRDMLSSRKAGGIIFTTIQKFSLLNGEKKHPVLSERNNIVVISDEAHRSQYGDKAKLNRKTGQYVFGYSKHLRDALPEASFIGFTGTPISLEDKDTRAVFGEYVSIYDIQEAVEDGATVPIYYESRLAKLDINQAEIATLNEQVDEVIEDEEDIAAREKTKSKWAALEKLVGSKPRLEQVAQDLSEHFAKHTEVLDGKAMIVCMSREICVDMYDALVAIHPEWHHEDPNKGMIKVIMTGAASDKEKLRPHIYSKETKKLLEKRYKKPDDPLKLVIVRDMWLTGFDVPCCHTMYVDKPMRGHNLMQAIARVNRVFKDKPGGLVVDYIGIANELKHALKIYTDSKGKGRPTADNSEAFTILLENIDKLRGLMHGCDYSKYETQAIQLLPKVAEHILSLTDNQGKLDGKKRFFRIMTYINKSYALCSTLDEAESLKKEIAFFAAVKAALMKSTNVNKKLSEEHRNRILKQIIDNSIVSEGIDDIFEMIGINRPNIGLLSPEFMKEIASIEHKNLAIELLEKLLRDEIRERMQTDVISERKYSDRLLETLRKYHNRVIETAQVIEELIQMAKDIIKDHEVAQKSGLTPDEISFYRALIQNESAVRELGDERLRELAKYITEKLRKSTSVDWQVRDSVRARLRNLVRRALRKWKYPPDKSEEAIDLCLQQAEVLSNHWSS